LTKIVDFLKEKNETLSSYENPRPNNAVEIFKTLKDDPIQKLPAKRLK